MKRRRFIWGLIALPIALVTVAALYVLYYTYVSPDPLEKVARDTHRMLGSYERTGDPRQVIALLTDLPGEGESMEVLIVFGEWSIHHQHEFVSLMNHMPEDKRAEFIESFVCSLGDSGQDRDFRAAFSKYHSPVLDQIRQSL